MSAARLVPARSSGCRIDREIGRGDMGVVYAATQHALDREVALKVMTRHRADDAVMDH